MASSSIQIDTSSFAKFARALKEIDPKLKSELRRELKAAGEVVAVDARARAAFSTRIPGRIKVGVTGNTIRVYVQPIKEAGHVREEFAFENKGKTGTFRHPVGGDRNNWVDQQAHPFLKPAAEAHSAEVVAGARRAVDAAMKEVDRRYG